MSYYPEVRMNFVPMIQYSEATQAVADQSDCVKIKTWAHETNRPSTELNRGSKLEATYIKGKKLISLIDKTALRSRKGKRQQSSFQNKQST